MCLVESTHLLLSALFHEFLWLFWCWNNLAFAIEPSCIYSDIFQTRKINEHTNSLETWDWECWDLILHDFVSVLFPFLMLRIALVWSALICLNLLKLVQITCSFIFDFFLGVAIPCMSRILECFPNFNEYFELFCVLLPWPALFWFFYFLLKY